MIIDFKDRKGVKVDAFNVEETYGGYLEGTRQTVTQYKLRGMVNKKGLFYITPELDNGALKPYVFTLRTSYQWEHRLEVVWYDDDMPSDISTKKYIQQKVKDIEFDSNCEFVDLDNL